MAIVVVYDDRRFWRRQRALGKEEQDSGDARETEASKKMLGSFDGGDVERLRGDQHRPDRT
jgi:hypothetical protein